MAILLFKDINGEYACAITNKRVCNNLVKAVSFSVRGTNRIRSVSDVNFLRDCFYATPYRALFFSH